MSLLRESNALQGSDSELRAVGGKAGATERCLVAQIPLFGGSMASCLQVTSGFSCSVKIRLWTGPPNLSLSSSLPASAPTVLLEFLFFLNNGLFCRFPLQLNNHDYRRWIYSPLPFTLLLSVFPSPKVDCLSPLLHRAWLPASFSI